MMYGLHTEDFLLALSRFCNTRSKPTRIVCDNAGQFTKGAKLLSHFNDEELQHIQREEPDIQFHFIPARTPHVNGVTERMVQSMKTALKHVITDGLLTDDELQTAAKKVQRILNSRPLSYQGSDDDLLPLTPSHFLADKAVQDIYVEDDKLDYRSRLKLVQQVTQDAWSRFKQEVIPKLNQVNKWVKGHPNLEVDDVVIVLDAEESGKFPIGRVVETYPGQDGFVRIVKVRIRGHETKRHSSRLMLLLREPSREIV